MGTRVWIGSKWIWCEEHCAEHPVRLGSYPILYVCPGPCSYLRGSGQARQIWAAALHQTFWGHDLVPGQRSQGGRAYSGYAEERAVSCVCVLLVFQPYFKSNDVTPVTVPADRRIRSKPSSLFVCFQAPGCSESSVPVPHGPPAQWVSPGGCQPEGYWHRPAEGDNTQTWQEMSADS